MLYCSLWKKCYTFYPFLVVRKCLHCLQTGHCALPQVLSSQNFGSWWKAWRAKGGFERHSLCPLENFLIVNEIEMRAGGENVSGAIRLLGFNILWPWSHLFKSMPCWPSSSKPRVTYIFPLHTARPLRTQNSLARHIWEITVISRL